MSIHRLRSIQRPKPLKVSQEFFVAGQPLHILIADENKHYIAMISRNLKEAGIKVTASDNPYYVAYDIKTLKPDMALIADRFPTSNIEFTSILTRIGAHMARTVILISHDGTPCASPASWGTHGDLERQSTVQNKILLDKIKYFLPEICGMSHKKPPSLEKTMAVRLIERKLTRMIDSKKEKSPR